MPVEIQKIERPEIKVMPNKDILERFLMGFHGLISVYYDREKGEFIDMNKSTIKPIEPNQ